MAIQDWFIQARVAYDEVKAATERAFRTHEAAQSSDLSRLEDRILMSATPVAVVAAPEADTTQEDAASSTSDTESGTETASTEQTDASVGEVRTINDSLDLLDQVSDDLSSAIEAEDDSIVYEVAFVDTQVEDYQQLVDSLQQQSTELKRIEVVLLNADDDGVEQISQFLQGREGISAIHLFSHGVDGALELGNTWLNSFSLNARAEAIAGWGQSLSADGDILLYGCDVAADEEGEAFVNRLAELTGADVTASSDATGSTTLGGDWVLEYATGSVETSIAIGAQTQQEWANIMAISVGNTTSSQTTGSSLTWSHTVDSGSNGILIVNIAYKSNLAAVTSVTYGGTALTLLGSETFSGGDATRAEMWYLKLPTTGTANVVINMSASSDFVAGATNYFGVDQATPTGSVVGSTGSGATQSVNVSSASDELVIDTLAQRAATSGSAGAGQTSLFQRSTGSGGSNQLGGSSREAGAASVTMSWTTSGGTEWALLAVSLKPGNTAPVLDSAQSPALIAQSEDSGAPSGAVGTLVSQLIDFASPSGQVDNVTDPDAGALLGIAVTSANTSNGSWYYSTNNGVAWNALGGVTDSTARLLAADANTRIYFQPNANYNGTLADAITFRAWDQTTGSNGTLADTSGVNNGGSTAYSTATDTASLTVTPVNDAPTMPGVALGSTSEDTTYTRLVSWLAGFSSDVDAGAQQGLAIVGVDDSNGTWQYTLNGTNWFDIGSVSENNALLLASDATSAFRFVPNANWNGVTGQFEYKAWDQTSGTAGTYVDASTSGGTTAFSNTSASTLTVTAVNDEQVISTNTGTTVTEGSTGNVITNAMLETTDVDNTAGQLTYTVTAVAGNGSLRLSGIALGLNDTFTQTDIDGGFVTYDHDDSETASDSFGFTVDDGVGTNSSGTFNITITPVNDHTPVITSDGGGPSATINVAENSTYVTNVQATDADVPADTLTYSIVGGSDAALFSIDSSTGLLTFVNAPDYEAPSDAGSDNVYDVNVEVSDGIQTDTQAIAVTVTDSMESILTGNQSAFGTAAGTSVTFSHTVADNDNRILLVSVSVRDDIAVSTVTYDGVALTRVGFDISSKTRAEMWALIAPNVGTANVVVTMSGSANFVAGATDFYGVDQTVPYGSVTTGNGSGDPSLTVSSALNELVVDAVSDRDIDNTVIGSGQDELIAYKNGDASNDAWLGSSTEAGNSSVTMSWTTNGSGAGEWAAVALSLKPFINTPPAITSNGGGNSATVNTAENGTAVTTVTTSDPDVPGQTLTYSIIGGADASKFNIDANTGVLTFATAPDFETPTDVGADNVYDVNVEVSDGTATDWQAIAVTVTDVNESPTISTNTGIAVDEGTTGNVIGNTMLNASDPDDSGTGLTYTITSVTGNGILRLSGTPLGLNDTFSQADIDSGNLTYDHNGSETVSDHFDFSLADGGEDGSTPATGSFVISVNLVNDAPVTAAIESGSLTYTENDGPVLITSTLSISDSDDSNIESATVRITGNYVDGEDFLVFTDQNGITGSWNSVTGELTLTGSATLANYQAALRSITYENTSDAPSVATRTVSFTVNDGDVGSNTLTRDITITAVNDAPVNIRPGSATVLENGTLTFSASTSTRVLVTDVDAGTASLQVSLVASNGDLTLSGTTGLSFSVGDGTADSSLTFTGSLSDINAALDGMTFNPTNGYTGAASIQMTTDDQGNSGAGGAQSDTETITVNVLPANVASLWLTTDKQATVNGGSFWTDGEAVSLSDPNLQFEPGTTNGTFSSVFDLDNFALDGDADLSGIHRVSRTVTVGTGGSSMTLQKGDLLFSIKGSDTLGGVFVDEADLALFRPTVADDYSSGTISILINSPTGGKIREVALVESNVTVGGVPLNAGDFLLVQGSATYDKDVWRFQATSVGDGTTAGTFTELIDGDDIGIDQQIGGMALIETTTTIGNVTFNPGELLINLRGSAVVGTDSLSVTQFDIFRLDVTQAGTTTVASASLLFEGADVGLSSGGEEFHGIALVATNYAPQLTGTNDFTGISEDPTVNSGDLVSDLISGYVSDPDESALSGIAVTAVENTNGVWQYSTNSGGSWTAFGSVSESSARLLAADGSTLVRFVPNLDYNGSANIQFRAWDQTQGTSGDTFNITSTGGSSAFSSVTGASSISVAPVNDAPVLDNSGSPTLTTITEDDITNNGDTVASIIASAGGDRITDVDAASVEGIAITSLNSGNGTWEYSTDGGGSWMSVETVSNSSALLLRDTDRIRFVPNSQDGTTASFDFRAWDQTSGAFGTKVDASTNGGTTAFSSAVETAAITVTPINDAPVGASIEAADLSYVENDGAIPITSTLSLSDVDDSHLESAVVRISGNYVNGEDVLAFTNQNGISGSWNNITGELTLTGTATVAHYEAALRSVTYENTSESPATLTRTISFTVNDGGVDSNTLTRDITITPVNDEENISTNTGTTVNEASTGNVISNAMLETTDADHTAGQLTYTVTAATGNGTLRLSGTALGVSDTFTQADIDAGWVTYDHDGSETLSDAFSFNVDDGAGTTSSGTFNLTITPVNDEEVLATNTGTTVNEASTGNAITTAMLQTTDVDNTAGQLTYTVTAATGNGTLRLSGTALGVSDTFTQADIDAGWVTYDHDGSETVSDSFDFSVDDGAGTNSSGTFNFTVTPVNDEKLVLATNTGTTVNEASTGNVISNAMLETTDVDNTTGQLVYTITAVTGNGTLRLSGTALGLSDTFTQADIDAGIVAYDHDGSETIGDAFDFDVDDAAGTISSGTFNLAITPVNDEEVLSTNTGTTVNEASTGNVITSGMLETTDVDNTASQLTYTVTAATGNGTLRLSGAALGVSDTFTQADINAGFVTYDHNGSETLSDSFSFTVDDGAGTSSSGTFNITVTAVNDEEVLATNTGTTVNEASSGNVITSAMLETTDIDNTAGQLVYTITSATSNGTLRLSGTALGLSDTFTQADIDAGLVTYDHNGSETVNDGFNFSVDDGAGTSSSGTFNFTVTPVNDVPIGNDDSYTVDNDSTLNTLAPGVLLNDVDNEGDALSVTLVSAPTSGTFSLAADGSFTYTPTIGSTGTDSFVYVISDGTDVSTPVTVVIVLNDVLGATTNPPVPDTPDPDTPDDTSDDTLAAAVITPNVRESEEADDSSQAGRRIELPQVLRQEAEASSSSDLTEESDWMAGGRASDSSDYVRAAMASTIDLRASNYSSVSIEFHPATLFDHFDSVIEDLENHHHSFELVAGSTIVASGAISVGFVAWAARASYFMTMLSSSLPAWSMVDPVPVLDSQGYANRSDKRRGSRQDKSLADIIIEKQVPVEVQLLDQHFQGLESLSGVTTRDISEHGIGLVSPQSIDAEHIRIRLTTPSGEKMDVLGSVRHCSGDGQHYHVGVSIVANWATSGAT